MKRILIPTDFSDLSRSSVFYAATLARELKCELVLLHIIDISNSEMLMKRQRLEEEVIELSRQDARQFIREIKTKLGENFPVTYEYRLGHPLHRMIENFVSQNGIDLVVIGTHGSTGIIKRMMGSTASAVINESSVPVIAVPSGASFSLRKIIYATDMSHLEAEVRLLTEFAAPLNASIHVVHVAAEGGSAPDRQSIRTKLALLGYPRVYFHLLKGSEITNVLDEFGSRSKNHVLAMFTHRFDFFDKLFGRSFTHELVARNHTPLLTFNKSTIGADKFIGERK